MEILQILKKLLPLIVLLFLFSACTTTRTLEDGTSTRYEVGDEWTYRTRPGEGLSTFTVIKIDQTTFDGEETTIIHVSVNELEMEHPDGGQVTTVPHMPFTEDALNRSTGSPFNIVDPIPQEALDAYENWKTRYETGEADIFNFSIATALNNLEITLQTSN